MNAPDWIKELELLKLLFPEYGVGVDLAALTDAKQWASTASCGEWRVS